MTRVHAVWLLASISFVHCQVSVEDGQLDAGLDSTSTGGFAPTSGGAANSGGAFGSGGFTESGGAPSSGGAFTTGGASGDGGSATGGGSSSPASDMPSPGVADEPIPTGSPTNLKVLDWAGFKAAASFTFDDTLTSQSSNYAALDAVGVPLTFYVVSNNNASNSVWAQAVLDGHELGNHTAHHCRANGTDCAWGAYAGSLASEFDQCTTHIENTTTQEAVWTSASPYGDGGYATTASSRFLLNRGVSGGQIAPNDATNPHALPCQTAAQNQSSDTFDAATNSARSAGKWQIFLIHSLGGDGGYNPLALSELVESITYAKNVGDVWADSVIHVGAYWRAQKLFTSLTPTTSGDTKTWTWTLPEHFPPGRFLRVRVDGGTLRQGDQTLTWDAHGYYEVALDAGTLTHGP